jgi:hypothetical protein
VQLAETGQVPRGEEFDRTRGRPPATELGSCPGRLGGSFARRDQPLQASVDKEPLALEQASKHSNSGTRPRCEKRTSVPSCFEVISKVISVPVHSVGSSGPTRWASMTSAHGRQTRVIAVIGPPRAQHGFLYQVLGVLHRAQHLIAVHQQLAAVGLGPRGELAVQRALWHVAASTIPVAGDVRCPRPEENQSPAVGPIETPSSHGLPLRIATIIGRTWPGTVGRAVGEWVYDIDHCRDGASDDHADDDGARGWGRVPG